MSGEKDLSREGDNTNSSRTKLPHRRMAQQSEQPDHKTSYPQDFLRSSSKSANELTLSYLCENNNNNNNNNLTNPSEKPFQNHKGKEIAVFDSSTDEKWMVERDFFSLRDTRSNSSKREVDEEEEGRNGNGIGDGEKKKKPKVMETLDLSLALPDASLSLTGTQHSNDFTAASMSYSYSHQFSHNPSCSMTRNSTENFDYSASRDDHVWGAGEGTNGSVHSRFRPIGDGVGLSSSTHGGTNGGGGSLGLGFSSLQSNFSLYKAANSSETNSFFPSELPAKSPEINQSGDSRKRITENKTDSGRQRKVIQPDRILRDIVSEPVTVIALMVKDFPSETLETTKEYLKSIIDSPEKRDALEALQNRLERRSDLTKETLSKCHKDQLDMLVAVRTGLNCFISGKTLVPVSELIEIFLFMRCKNVNCKGLLPVEDCDCKICSTNPGFCSSCMCPVCMNFDCASNTCSWVGCDVCSHWCHATCGIQKNLIKPGPSLKGPAGTTEMLFHCIGCGHVSEMFGFVKDVFLCCAKNWDSMTLIKEIDCVRKIFRGSDDSKGKELHFKTNLLFTKLQTKMLSPPEACNFIIQFFNYSDTISDFPVSGTTSKDLMETDRNDEASITAASPHPPKYSMYTTSSSSGLLSGELRQKDLGGSRMSNLKLEDDFRFRSPSKSEGFDSLESLVRIKEAESRMFQSKADEARREAESFKRMIRAKVEKLDEEYAEKLAKLCLQETEETRRKKLEQLKVLENAHCDYRNMKLRMEAEIAGLLKRMEVTKQQWV